jgi:hypothetical protein
MKTVTKFFVSAGLLIIFTPAPVLAQDTNTPRIDQRQENQEERIEQGVQSGQLTPREAGKLEAQQNHIEHHEEAAKADGVVTKRERAHLTRQQSRASRHVHRKKHNLRHKHPHG